MSIATPPDAVVANLLALLDALGIRVADVVGFSYGPETAQRLALALSAGSGGWSSPLHSGEFLTAPVEG